MTFRKLIERVLTKEQDLHKKSNVNYSEHDSYDCKSCHKFRRRTINLTIKQEQRGLSLTIKNCDRTFLKNIIRFKKAKKLNKNRRRFDVNVTSLSSQKCVKTEFYKY